MIEKVLQNHIQGACAARDWKRKEGTEMLHTVGAAAAAAASVVLLPACLPTTGLWRYKVHFSSDT